MFVGKFILKVLNWYYFLSNTSKLFYFYLEYQNNLFMSMLYFYKKVSEKKFSKCSYTYPGI